MSLARDTGVDRIVYVSSVHAIPERPANEIITEVSSFSPNLVHGQYAKSKAAAAQIVMDYAKAGLNVSIVHPSGIIGPGDTRSRNHMIRTIQAISDGKISVGLQGGYDFVDSRDVADGIIGCEEKGRPGECYILNGHYIGVLELVNSIRKIRGKKTTRIEAPHALAKLIAPVAEYFSRTFSKDAPLLTPYSVYTLHTNGRFSHEKATREFDYHPRPMEESIRDSL
jgi:dihydroflavonol-4-reductase